MIAASKPRLKGSISIAEPPTDECSDEECSDEDEIPHPSAEQDATQLQPSAMPSDAVTSISASTGNAGAPHLHPV